MEFEQDTLEKVISARAKAVSSVGVRKGRRRNTLTETLGKLFAVMENYPDLKSNANIIQLQEELTSTENKISFSRQLYNDLVANYRIRQDFFPIPSSHLFSADFRRKYILRHQRRTGQCRL